jgi:hypothetical protein
MMLLVAGALPGSVALMLVPLLILLTGGAILWVLRKQ